MKQTLTTGQAASILLEDNNANWSYAGAYALCEYLEQCEEDGGVEIELDPVALRCEFDEYASAEDWADVYWRDSAERDRECGIDRELDSVGESEEKVLAYLKDRAGVIEFNGGIIVQEC
jgi:hypothetical protein